MEEFRLPDYWCRRGPSFTLPFILFIVAISATISASAEVYQELTHIVPNKPTFYRVAATKALSLTLAGKAGTAAEIFLETSGPGAEFALFAPDGRQLQSIRSEYPEWLAVSFSLDMRGQYRLVASAKLDKDRPDGVVFRAVSLPRPAIGAKNRLKAELSFASAQTLLHSPKAADLLQAITLFKQAAIAWGLDDDREGQILALAGEARALLGLSEHDGAIASLSRAVSICDPSSFWHSWLRNLLAQVYLDRWDNELARTNAQLSLQLSRSIYDEWLTADALADRGESEYLTHNPLAATDIEKSLRMAQTSHYVSTLARALRCNAWIEKDQGHLTHAFSLLDKAREYFHQEGNIRAEMQAMSTLATIESSTGDPYSSLLRHTKLLGLMRDTGFKAHYAMLLENIGADYETLNRVPDAIAYYGQALAAFRSTRHTSGEAQVLSDLCSAEMRVNNLSESLRNCRSAAVLVEQFHDQKRKATSNWRLGIVERALGQTDSAIESFRQAAALSDSVHDARFESQALIDWGDTIDRLGKRDEARGLFERALPLSIAAENIPLQLEARYRIAHSEFEVGHDETAKRDLNIALDTIDAMRHAVGNGDLRASYFAQMRKCHDLYVDILMKEQAHDVSSVAAARALEISESGRALTLLDTLAAHGPGSTTGRQTTASLEIRNLHAAVEQAFDQRLKLMIEGTRPRELNANAQALTQAIDMLERAEDELKASTVSPPPAGRTLSAAEIIAGSQYHHSTLVEYALGTEHSYVWVIDGGKIESHVLPARDLIETAVRRWLALATARIIRPGESVEDHLKRVEAADRDLPQLASTLSCTLLGPFLRQGMQQLAIVPDGELQLLPFAALPENGCKGAGEPLAIERQIVLVPSLSVLLARHEVTSSTTFLSDVAIFADPVFDRDDPRVGRTDHGPSDRTVLPIAPALPRLIGTRDEAKAIAALAGSEHAALYLDFDASLKPLLSPSLRGYKILHLASHGILDESMPAFSGIVLSLVGQDGQPVFGYLKTHDILGLDLHSDLVVLSSCDSAAGINLSGEGVAGLNHAFLSAGAKRVVSTLWSVDDETSKELMISFYTGMLRDELDPAEALRRSQVNILRRSRTAAPYYWAAFNITSAIQ